MQRSGVRLSGGSPYLLQSTADHEHLKNVPQAHTVDPYRVEIRPSDFDLQEIHVDELVRFEVVY